MFTARIITDFYPVPYFSAVLCSPSKAGKTHLAAEIVRHWSHFVPGGRLGCFSLIYDTFQSKYTEMIDSLPTECIVESFQGLPQTNDDLAEHATDAPSSTTRSKHVRPMVRIPSDRQGIAERTKNGRRDWLVLIDDCVYGQKTNEFVRQLLCVRSHHSHCNVIIIVQTLFDGTTLSKTIRQNVDFILILKSVQATSTLLNLQRTTFVKRACQLTTAAALLFHHKYRYYRACDSCL